MVMAVVTERTEFFHILLRDLNQDEVQRPNHHRITIPSRALAAQAMGTVRFAIQDLGLSVRSEIFVTLYWILGWYMALVLAWVHGCGVFVLCLPASSCVGLSPLVPRSSLARFARRLEGKLP